MGAILSTSKNEHHNHIFSANELDTIISDYILQTKNINILELLCNPNYHKELVVLHGSKIKELIDKGKLTHEEALNMLNSVDPDNKGLFWSSDNSIEHVLMEKIDMPFAHHFHPTEIACKNTARYYIRYATILSFIAQLLGQKDGIPNEWNCNRYSEVLQNKVDNMFHKNPIKLPAELTNIQNKPPENFQQPENDVQANFYNESSLEKPQGVIETLADEEAKFLGIENELSRPVQNDQLTMATLKNEEVKNIDDFFGGALPNQPTKETDPIDDDTYTLDNDIGYVNMRYKQLFRSEDPEEYKRFNIIKIKDKYVYKPSSRSVVIWPIFCKGNLSSKEMNLTLDLVRPFSKMKILYQEDWTNGMPEFSKNTNYEFKKHLRELSEIGIVTGSLDDYRDISLKSPYNIDKLKNKITECEGNLINIQVDISPQEQTSIDIMTYFKLICDFLELRDEYTLFLHNMLSQLLIRKPQIDTQSGVEYINNFKINSKITLNELNDRIAVVRKKVINYIIKMENIYFQLLTRNYKIIKGYHMNVVQNFFKNNEKYLPNDYKKYIDKKKLQNDNFDIRYYEDFIMQLENLNTTSAEKKYTNIDIDQLPVHIVSQQGVQTEAPNIVFDRLKRIYDDKRYAEMKSKYKNRFAKPKDK